MSRKRTAEQLDEVERRLDELSHRLERQLESISNQLELVKTMFTLKDPAVGSSADAYEGLRRTVVLAREDKMARLVDLARVDAAATTKGLTADLGVLLDELLTAAGMQRVASMEDLELFDVFGDPGDGQSMTPQLIAPAYVHLETGAVVRLGRCELVDLPSEEPEPEPTDHREQLGGKDGAACTQDVAAEPGSEQEQSGEQKVPADDEDDGGTDATSTGDQENDK
jgi:hypothetical protein